MDPLSGRQLELSAGDYRAGVATIGASLRALTWQDRPLVVPFAPDEVRPAYRGAILAPWPNRVVDGKYAFAGAEHELALTEPDRGHALHGLVVWQDFTVVTEEPSRVSLATTVVPQNGYPFRIALLVTYALSEQGLAISVEATNTGPSAAPFGTSVHPYLTAGAGVVDDWSLQLPAASVLTVTPDRLVPREVRPVTEAPEQFDFRAPRPIADTFLDHAFTDFSPDADGRFSARLTDAAGSGVVMHWDDDCRWLQVHTADLPAPKPSRIGLAVEPMTCPPDAFNSGTDLLVLAPEESTTVRWRIAAV